MLRLTPLGRRWIGVGGCGSIRPTVRSRWPSLVIHRFRVSTQPDAGPGATVYLDAVVGVGNSPRLKLAGVLVGGNTCSLSSIFPSTAH
jgi:hypothetical protein